MKILTPTFALVVAVFWSVLLAATGCSGKANGRDRFGDTQYPRDNRFQTPDGSMVVVGHVRVEIPNGEVTAVVFREGADYFYIDSSPEELFLKLFSTDSKASEVLKEYPRRPASGSSDLEVLDVVRIKLQG